MGSSLYFCFYEIKGNQNNATQRRKYCNGRKDAQTYRKNEIGVYVKRLIS